MRPESKAARWLTAGFVALLAIASGLGCWYQLFTTFRPYDDEGYVLISLEHVRLGHLLYTEVFSQYGPAFYAIYNSVAAVFGFEWTNTVGRNLTLFHWLAASLLCSHLVWRVTRSAAASIFALAAVIAALWVMVYEPSHPGGAIVFLVSLAAWIGGTWNVADRSVPAFLVGTIIALLVLIKINVGILLAFPIFLWVVLALPKGRWSGVIRVVCATAAFALPWLLMRPLLYEEWTRRFATMASITGLAAVVVLQAQASRTRPKTLLVLILGGLVAAGGVLAYTVVRGTSWHDLLEGVILSPIRHPLVYSVPPTWRLGAFSLAITSLVLSLIWLRRPHLVYFNVGLALARLVVGILTALCVLRIIALPIGAFALNYGVPMAALMALPLNKEGRNWAAAGWLAALLVFQSLHAFPISGSQLNWGTFLWFPLLALGWHDAWITLAREIPLLGRLSPSATRAVTLACVLFATWLAGNRIYVSHRDFENGVPLQLAGAERLALSVAVVLPKQIMVENAKVYADTLYSLPGCFSFNLWSGRPTPNSQNVTHWFSLLSVPQQKEIASKMLADPRSAFIVEQGLLRYLMEDGYFKGGYLASVFTTEFHQAFELGGYGFWVRKGREIAPVDVGTRSALPDATGKLTMTLVLASRPTLPTRITVSALEDNAPVETTLEKENSLLRVTPLNENGTEITSTRVVPWGSAAPSPAPLRLDLSIPNLPALPIPRMATGFDQTGAMLWRVPVVLKE